MKIHQIWLHPVKSMAGSTVDWCDLDDLGMVGDRVWATRDVAKARGIPHWTTDLAVRPTRWRSAWPMDEPFDRTTIR